MINILLIIISLNAISQINIDELRWYVKPNNQKVTVEIDDLNDEILQVHPDIDGGFEIIDQYNFKKVVTVAIIDGGVDVDHPQIRSHLAFDSSECYDKTIIPEMKEDHNSNQYLGDCIGWNWVEKNNRPYDEDGHGTHIAGIITHLFKNKSNHVKILPLKVFAPDEGRRAIKGLEPLSMRLEKSFEYAINMNVDIIHLSVGWPRSFMTQKLSNLIRKASDNNIMIVAAAGNSSQRAMIYPCQLKEVICVGALRANGDIASFSNWGSQVDFFAPGEKILSTIPLTIAPVHLTRKGFDYKNGTSQAAPFVTSAFIFLKGLYPDYSNKKMFTMLFSSAREGSYDSGLKKMFNLREALKEPALDFIPRFKGISTIKIDGRSKLKINIPFEMVSGKSKSILTSLSCDNVNFTIDSQRTTVNLGLNSTNFEGTLLKELDFINCQFILGKSKYFLRFKIIHDFLNNYELRNGIQDELWVARTPLGARSKFQTIPSLSKELPRPYYYLHVNNNISVFHLEKQIGILRSDDKCKVLRIWQTNSEHHRFILESICNEEFLTYSFYNQSLDVIFKNIRFTPTLTILNYNDLNIINQKNKPPTLRFINEGFSPVSDNPWDSSINIRKNRLYELQAELVDDQWIYKEHVLEYPQKWQEDLSLRLIPDYVVHHLVDNKLLIEINRKSVWVNLETQEASWANLDHILWRGSQKQVLKGTDNIVFQSLFTPYSYRGYLNHSDISLDFIIHDLKDPIMDIIFTAKSETGYLTVLRTFQHLWYLFFDDKGNLINYKKVIVERYDFLSSQDLISIVSDSYLDQTSIQTIDGSKINSTYIDIVKGQVLRSYEVPLNCTTQSNVRYNNKIVLPLFCNKSRTEYEIRLIPLSDD